MDAASTVSILLLLTLRAVIIDAGDITSPLTVSCSSDDEGCVPTDEVPRTAGAPHSTPDWKRCAFTPRFGRCLKVALLHRVDDFIQRWGHVNRPYRLLGGLVTLEKVPEDPPKDDLDERKGATGSLDSRIVQGLTKIFRDRVLRVAFLPGVNIRVLPDQDSPALVKLSFKYDGDILGALQARKKSGGMDMTPWMLVGPLISLGFLPFALANIKMMVMTAMSLNNMALGSAVFTAIRSAVFGPRPGPTVVYKNYGYRQTTGPDTRHPPKAYIRRRVLRR